MTPLPGEQRKPNRLIREKSPYLLQHSYNPVDWYPWCEEAFEKAKQEDKPIFLSIGYSACHWCHRMEKESFDDPEVAEKMNEVFVCIKVDREERPDIDRIYMEVCQMMTGTGGWPLTIIMTPEKKPFFAGTYFPKKTFYGQLGLIELTERVKEIWKSRKEDCLHAAEKITRALQERELLEKPYEPGFLHIKEAFSLLEKVFDTACGGFGTAPKFPTAQNLLFLLRYWKRTGDENALRMAEKTLIEMAKGGIYDHIGGGFHRYSTDRYWHLPHFEKMLYDQAMMAMTYCEAYLATQKPLYARISREVCDYVLRNLASPEGGFYTSEDADSEGEEGKFYLWTVEEIFQELGEKDATQFVELCSLRREGNFSAEGGTPGRGKNVVHLVKTHEEWAQEKHLGVEDWYRQWENWRQRLFLLREKRPHPFRDTKILLDVNGLMVAALAKGGRVFGETRYVEAATQAADFLLSVLALPEGKLFHQYSDGVVAHPGYLDDYAFFIWGLLELYESTFETRYLEKAIQFQEYLLSHFWDEKNGGFYFTSDEVHDLIIRPKEFFEGAIPTGNSVSLMNLARLATITGGEEWRDYARRLAKSAISFLERYPLAFTHFLSAVDFLMGPVVEVVIVGNRNAEDVKQMVQSLQREYLPHLVMLFRDADEENPAIVTLAPFVRPMIAVGGKATAYVCHQHACREPTTEVKKMLEYLQEMKRSR
ncbi:MAG: thioredoxin domain-containing protein [bacterium JZ-2024 1]